MGDTILLAGCLRDLRKANPHARIILYTGVSNRSTAELLPCVDEILPVPVTNPWLGLPAIRQRHVDVLFDFGQWSRINALYSWAARAQYTVGFRTPGQYRHYLYDQAVDHRADQHETNNYKDIIRTIGIEANSTLGIDADPGASPVRGRYVVFHPWPSGMLSHLREWSPERWVELSKLVRARGYQVVLTGSCEDKIRSEELGLAMGEGDDIVVRAGADSLRVLRDLLAAASAVVSVNTGVMHLAAAVGAPTVGLNGPTSELRWGPIGANAHSVSVRPPLGGYLNLGFEYKGQHLESMSHIEVRSVWEALQPLLDPGK